MEAEDPSVVRSIAITAEDLVAALEASRRSGRDAVVRVTPPFSGRMRARLHVEGTSDYDADEVPRPIHVDPERLVAESAPDYPSPSRTEDELRNDPDDTYSRDRHHERHAEAVADWRRTVVDHVVDSVELETSAGPHEVDVALLGQTT